MTIAEIHKKFLECSQEISTDTRTMIPGAMFFAWKGEVVDGNDYVAMALEKGAKWVICDDIEAAELNDRCILVSDTIETLQALARYHRQQFDIPVIAIGGSNGKTTTKELLAQILKQQKDTVASFGSLNNHTGVPLTLLRINPYTDIAVLEMGANHIGEIAELCAIAEPTHGLITNIGRDHIGLFGGIDGVLEANLELYTYLKNNNGFIFMNKNDDLLMKHIPEDNYLCYGVSLEGENGIKSLHTSPYISGAWKNHTITTKLTGEYNLENIIAAISVAKYLDIQDESVIKAIEEYNPNNNRSTILKTENNIIIKDYYNANRTSMELAIDNLVTVTRNNEGFSSVAILGDMLELGEFSDGEHQAVLKYAEDKGIENIILIGPDFKKLDASENIIQYENVDTAILGLKEQVFKNTCILFKASNGTNLNKLFESRNW
ncbi:MAG: UDP-N-acetylmuramoyl-tripeptide--D-alanyl-D-alanine ligase [Candidatus Pacebacteria bacterium]|nr:UDP-N-acetylmuramoyl-tripeptide--D-alanyl-D-alanine ligase [Candidatus Paceibacterota bacterium]